MMAHNSFLLSLLITLAFLHLVNGSTFRITSYGAKADGVTDNSAGFLKAWSAACSASQAATLYVPSGQFLLHPALFSGPCKNSKIIVQVDGNLIASTDYKLYGAAGYIMKFNNVKGLSFQGRYIDGKGSALWACKAGKGNCPYGARVRKAANEAGVQNVTVKNVVFTGSTNGLRIKSWARSSTGFTKGIVFDGATMNNVANPIIIDQHYCPNNQGCSNQNSGVKISQVTYNNIKGTSATQVAVDFSCSASAPCQGIKMSNVQLTYKGQPAKASCDHAFGSSSGSVSPPSCLKSSASNRRLLGLGIQALSIASPPTSSQTSERNTVFSNKLLLHRSDPMAHNSFLLSFLLSLALLIHLVNGTTFSVMSYGAKADGVADNSAAFQKAWLAVCSASQAGILYVPSGQFLLHPTLFSGPCKNSKIVVQVDGNLVASPDYNLYGAAGYIMKFNNVQGLSFQGGYIDGKGSALWACKAGKGTCPYGARSLVFSNSRDITLTGLTSVNSELFHIVIDTCTNVKVDGLKITASSTSPNTDGIHVEQSTGVTITNSNIGTGDDCISIGSGTQNLWIEKIACGPGHGISVGSLGKDAQEAGVQNVTVKNVQQEVMKIKRKSSRLLKPSYPTSTHRPADVFIPLSQFGTVSFDTHVATL
ncbi:putative rhamnogalacturonase A [Nymphaea thermarum]|nr:putative rhamnogalacturonase A [Nymphaea thermarum]